MRVLVVEDEKDLNSIICSKLVKEAPDRFFYHIISSIIHQSKF